VAQQSDATLLYLIKQVELAVRSHLDEAVAPADLTSLQYTALTVLQRHPGLTSAELARNSFVRAQTMAQMITFLEGRNFIRREVDPNSRRQHLLSLTDEGEQVIEELKDSVSAVERTMVSGMSSDDRDDLRAKLRSCRIALGGGEAR
jgi:DNA-binding MarR family transcriptional regulator